MLETLFAAAGFAESNGDLTFNPFGGMFLCGGIISVLAFLTTLFLFRENLRKLTFSGEIVAYLISSIVFGFLFGAMISTAFATVF